MIPSAADFDAFFHGIHGYNPFPWQRRLCQRVLNDDWPRVLQLPTASGKTAVMDIAIFALACGAPAARRRIAFVVDRRVVVDEASQRAHKVAAALRREDGTNETVRGVGSRLREMAGTDVPVVTATLRGGILRDDGWARSPAQPVLICSTVDQVGSRLLFRGYGCGSPRSWPIHAGLLGVDTLLIVDEAHCAQPFCETSLAVAERYGTWTTAPVGKPLSLMRMSATVGEQGDFGLEEDDYRDPELVRRLTATKPSVLELVDAGRARDPRAVLAQKIVEVASRLAGETPRVVGIVVNRVRTARTVFEALPLPPDQKLLLTGRVRAWERDRLLERWEKRLVADSGRPAPAESAVVVATQCIEVGANLDFDALVTECAAVDSLRQRFGRLNRLGMLASAPGYVVAEVSQVEDGAEDDPVYGSALRETWLWLQSVATHGGDGPTVDFGASAIRQLLPEDESLRGLCTPAPHAPILLPSHLDLFAQTSPEPEPSPDPGLFLHGPSAGADDVTVVWRADLDPQFPDGWADIVAVAPPLAGEGCPLPFVAVRAWLNGRQPPQAADADITGTPTAEELPAERHRPALRWRGLDDSEVVDAWHVRPGDTLAVPAAYGGCDDYGWNPVHDQRVIDLADAVGAHARHRPVLRLHDSVVTTWLRPDTDPEGAAAEAVAGLRRWAAGDDDIEPATLLSSIAATTTLPRWSRELCLALARDRRRRLIRLAGQASIVGSRPLAVVDDESESDFSETDDRSSLTAKVTLERHSIGVQAWAARFAHACGLPDPIVRDIALAAWLHDIGKADPRFQVYLCGGDEVAAALQAEPLAKSDVSPRNAFALRKARERAKYPRGGRHELQSLALIEACPPLLSTATDPDLVCHLVSSHHGYGRPLAPVIDDQEGVEVQVVHGGITSRAWSAHRLHELDSGMAERFWRLVRKYGWWRLAFLEAVVRLADHRRSEAEQQEGGAA